MNADQIVAMVLMVIASALFGLLLRRLTSPSAVAKLLEPDFSKPRSKAGRAIEEELIRIFDNLPPEGQDEMIRIGLEILAKQIKKDQPK